MTMPDRECSISGGPDREVKSDRGRVTTSQRVAVRPRSCPERRSGGGGEVKESFLASYASIATEYLRCPTERELYRASQLGREVVAAGWGPLQVTELHFETLEVLGRVEVVAEPGLAEGRLRPLFLELMSVFDASHRSVRDLVDTLQDRCQDLEHARSEVQHASSYMENVVRSMNDALLVVDLQGVVRTVNQTTLAWLRCETSEVVGRPAEQLFVEPDQSPLTGDRLEQLLAVRNVHNINTMMGIGRGPNIPVSLSARVMEDQAGDALGMVVVARDVTEVEKLITELQESREQLRLKTLQLVQTEKMKALGELTAGVAHELNQPLNAVRLTCEDIVRDIRRDRLDLAELGEGMEDVVREVCRMSEIVDHMRVYSRRVDEPRLELLDAKAPVEGVLRLLGRQLQNHNIEVVFDMREGLLVRADPVRLEQVILNLISNARDAVGQLPRERKRQIDITLGAVPAVGATPAQVVYTVADNGPGMSPEVRERVFEPFFTTKSAGEGTGLGLSVSYGIVQEHSGKLEVTSELGEGTRFQLLLPAVEDWGDERETVPGG